MDTLQALILGVVQGLAEYLPISSSGHLEIMKDLLGLDMSGADSLEFDLMLHVATVLSTIVVLWKEFVPLCQSFFTLKNDSNTIYVLKILVSCIPVAIVGFCFKDWIETLFESNLLIVGICLCVTAALLTFSYFFRTSPLTAKSYKPRDITWLDAIIIGCAQAVAVLPGLSRSGSTIATGVLIGDKREKVAQFSFFMVIIPILGEGLLDLKDMLMPAVEATETAASAAVGFIPLIVGFVASFIVGCLACKWMLELVKKGKLVWFALYCVIVGALCIIFS
ncbi:MAG: undecaprenyl-diphosphate phosphatase [Bacteroidales bacterium]|nr:undecaprenyl-diphosphate phosphatase [Bacteroidales bacterium]